MRRFLSRPIGTFLCTLLVIAATVSVVEAQTVQYGAYIGDQSVVNPNPNFNLYSAGANSKNVFEGRVGIGTTSPSTDAAAKLHLYNGGAAVAVYMQNAARTWWLISDDGPDRFGIYNPTISAYPLIINGRDNSWTATGGATLTAGGVWADASSREYKKDVAPLTLDKAVETLNDLNPVIFGFKVTEDERHVGFIAEEVPELVATKDRKGLSPMDIVAVLTKVVQDQQRKIEELSARVNGGR